MSPVEANRIPIDDEGEVLFLTLPTDWHDEDIEQIQHRISVQMTRADTGGLILDLSRMDVIDSYAIRKLDDLSRSAKIMGVPPIVMGLQPESAVVLVEMGLEFSHARTASTLRKALKLLREERGS